MLISILLGTAIAQDPFSLVREICVVASGEFDLGFLQMSNTSDVGHWVSDNGSTAVVAWPLITEATPGLCAPMRLNWYGETVKFNGYAAGSPLWHHYFVGQCPYNTGTCAAGYVFADSNLDGVISSGAVVATPCGDSLDLCWTDTF